MLLETATTTQSLLLGLIATLVGGLIWVVKSNMKRGDDILTRSDQITREALHELKRAVDTFASFKVEQASLHATLIADLRGIVTTQERILEIQERILRNVEELKP